MQTNIIKHFLVIFTIVLSGSLVPFIFSRGYTSFILVFTGILIFIICIFRKIKFKINFLLFLLLIISCLGILFFIREDFQSASTYFGFYFRFFIAFLLVSLINRDFFINSYTSFFVYYGFFSLIMYGIGIMSPNFIYSLPIAYNDAGTGYRHLYVFFYQGVEFWNFRNAGMFWEAGAFQVFLVLALIFESFIIKGNKIRKFILILSIISTLSVIGIVIIGLFSGIFIFNKKSKIAFLTPLLLLPLLLTSGYVQELVNSKFTGTHSSGNERLVGQIADIKVWYEYPFFGAGLEDYSKVFKINAVELGAIVPTSTNSFTGMMALNGVFYSLLIFIVLFLFIFTLKISFMEKLFISFIFIILLSSQGVLNQILFLCFLFYGIKSLTIKKREEKSEKNYFT
jgi:hypothetical protein